MWVVQGLLAVAFLGAGGAKLTQPKEKLAKNMERCGSSERWRYWAPSGSCCQG